MKFAENSGIDWNSYMVRQLEYRIDFIQKWILENPFISSGSSLILDYDQFLQSPKSRLREVLEFLSTEHVVDSHRIEILLERIPVNEKKHRVLPSCTDSQLTLANRAIEVWEEYQSRFDC
ncbi:MAG: hypothetical protein GY694_19110 [Gammaproteobacteria bacterium]|nr:hypothetical protein [Gammaproteobacteria bacterium]